MINSIKIYCTLTCLVLTISAHAQVTSNTEIQIRLDAFLELTNQKKYNEAFDLLYPKMFSQIGKQELVDLMTAMEKEGMSLLVTNRRISKFSAPFREGNEDYVRIDYTADVAINIADGGMYDSPKAAQAMMDQFQAIYGEPNVQWSADDKTYKIQATKAMMAIRQDGKEWYLAEINTDQMELMKSLFSEAVINALVQVK